MASRLRIMHGLSEIAGQNTYSVRGLREIGEDAECVVYYRHPFAYPYDRCLHIDKSNRILFPWYACRLGAFFLYAMGKYDCFHFHFGHSILNGIELSFYKRCGKKIFFEFHGSDLRDYKRFSRISGMPYNPKDSGSVRQRKRNQRICRAADGIIVHDDELIPYLPEERSPVYVVPLRVNIAQFQPRYPDIGAENIRIVHAPSNRAIKGTAYILEAFERLKSRYQNIELVLVEGMAQRDAFAVYQTADIVVDQLFLGTYGVLAIENMALGKPVVTYISEAMREKLPEELPVISAGKDTIETVLESLIKDGGLRRRAGIAGRKYVETYHDCGTVANILRDIYYGRARPLTGREAFQKVKDYKTAAERRENA